MGQEAGAPQGCRQFPTARTSLSASPGVAGDCRSKMALARAAAYRSRKGVCSFTPSAPWPGGGGEPSPGQEPGAPCPMDDRAAATAALASAIALAAVAASIARTREARLSLYSRLARYACAVRMGGGPQRARSSGEREHERGLRGNSSSWSLAHGRSRQSRDTVTQRSTTPAAPPPPFAEQSGGAARLRLHREVVCERRPVARSQGKELLGRARVDRRHLGLRPRVSSTS